MKDIVITLTTQSLALREDNAVLYRCAVSAAAKGAGEENGSFKTPRGSSYHPR